MSKHVAYADMLTTLVPNESILSSWHDAGCMGATIIFFQVVKLGKKMIRVRDERGKEAWRYPYWFNNTVYTQADMDEMNVKFQGTQPSKTAPATQD